MSTVIDWLSRLTAYGYIDLGSDLIMIVLLCALLRDFERLFQRIGRDNARADDVLDDELVEDEPRDLPPDVVGPTTVPTGTAIDDGHELIRRELDGHTFSFRPSEPDR